MARRRTDEPKIGDNSNLNLDEQRQLHNAVREIEALEADKREISEQISALYKSLKTAGFDTKALRHTIRLRRLAADERDAFERHCDAYRHALGMLADTPLGRAAMKRDGVAPE
jgi:uncharacterized protein (UPF0335 family)